MSPTTGRSVTARYALLVRAMERSGLAGIGKFVMRGRQYLGCLRVRDGLLTLEQMHFADDRSRMTKKELARAVEVAGRR